MTIAEAREKGKRLAAGARALGARIPKDALVLAVLLLASLASFGLGYLAGRDRGAAEVPLTIEVAPGGDPSSGSAATASLNDDTAGQEGSGPFVASKNGTKFYLPSCSGAKRISDANKVWFASEAAATAEGYAPAANCPGL